MISQTAEYALRAVAYLARSPKDPHVTREIARVTKVPSGYLAKVMQTLVRAGIVRSRRGQGGGFTLVRSPSAISILDVVNAVEPLQRIHSCPLGLEEHRDSLCPLHQRLDQTVLDIERVLAESCIADMMVGPKGHVPLGRVRKPADP